MNRGTTLKARIRPTKLGEMLRLYRTIRQLTLRDLAAETGIGHATLMRIEHGQAFDAETPQIVAILQKQLADARALLDQARQQAQALRTALETMLDRYVSLVNSGDCGNWNPQEEPEVQAALKVLGVAQETQP